MSSHAFPDHVADDSTAFRRAAEKWLGDGLRPEVVLPCLVTPDLIRGPFAQRWKNGFRIESGMTKV
jgi:hypothetical protein